MLSGNKGKRKAAVVKTAFSLAEALYLAHTKWFSFQFPRVASIVRETYWKSLAEKLAEKDNGFGHLCASATRYFKSC